MSARYPHPWDPFAGPAYRSLMPAADFSPWVAGRLAAGDREVVAGLPGFLASEAEATVLRRTFVAHDFGRCLEEDGRIALRVVGHHPVGLPHRRHRPRG